MNKYLTFSIFIMGFYVAAPYLLYGMSTDIPLRTAAYFAVASLTSAAVTLFVGCLGLLYRRDRFSGFAALTLAIILVRNFSVSG